MFVPEMTDSGYCYTFNSDRQHILKTKKTGQRDYVKIFTMLQMWIENSQDMKLYSDLFSLL